MKKIKIKAPSKNIPQVKNYARAANQHITPKGQNWQIKSAGAKRATKICITQKEAISEARKIAIKNQTELFIHSRNGKIRERNSYGRDPFSPRG